MRSITTTAYVCFRDVSAFVYEDEIVNAWLERVYSDMKTRRNLMNKHEVGGAPPPRWRGPRAQVKVTQPLRLEQSRLTI